MVRCSSSFIRLALGVCVFLPLMAWAAAPVISSVSVETRDNDAEFISFNSNVAVTPKRTFSVPNPDRIAIDIPHASGAGVKLPNNYSGRLIKAIRFGQNDKNTSRIVLDLNYPATVSAVNPGAPFGIELKPTQPLPAESAPPSSKVFNAREMIRQPVPATNTNVVPPPERGRLGGGQGGAASNDRPNLSNHPDPHPTLPLSGGGLKPAPAGKKVLPLIAIDAGHGGQDPGATGLHATHERDVTLAFARALAAALNKTGRYRALLTRPDDHFIMLGERVNVARRAHADLFVSLHADSNPNPDARGLSIYTLSATASDDEAAALAERENKSDIITGIDLNTTDQDVANILIDLTQRETMNKSLTLADDIVSSMSPRINRLEATHRFAGFRVLKAPDIPSVLIELGFITNVTDERLLLSPNYRELVVSSIVKGIDRYQAAQ